MRKAAVGAVVLTVVCLLLLWGSGVPLIPGRAPTTSNPDPVAIPPGAPLIDVGAVQFPVSQLDLEALDADGPSAPAADSRASVEISGRNPLLSSDPEVDLDRDFGEARPEPGGSARGTEGALAAVLLALVVLKAADDEACDRRRRAVAASSAA